MVMKKLLFLFFCVLAGIVVGSKLILPRDSQLPHHPKAISTQNVLPTPSLPTKGIIPKTLAIPSLNITANVESVGMDNQGRMDIPKNDFNVAWYNLGFKPGDKGSSVIDGHFDRVSGAPAVFYLLGNLKKGEKIIVSNGSNEELTFVVTKKAYYPFNAFPLEEVFNTTDKPRLNLITCDGVFDTSTHNYSQRLVIYSELET
jgi:LPXTG-site transpeptidase (sortase) family protein